MNTAATRQTPALIELVDFKWLMFTDGHAVHLERLQGDPGYARRCLQTGAASGCQTLRWCSQRLMQAMDLG